MTTINNSLIDAGAAVNSFEYCTGDCVLFSGIASALAFSRSIGDSFIATGTNQQINVAECGRDDSIYDLSHGLQLTFYSLEEQSVISAAYLKVVGFGDDTTGKVQLNAALGQTATVTPDGKGGSLLNIGGAYGGVVHFAGDPVANLKAHIVTS
jgi:hypothetical protein